MHRVRRAAATAFSFWNVPRLRALRSASEQCARSSTMNAHVGISGASPAIASTSRSIISWSARALVQPPGAWLTSTATIGARGATAVSRWAGRLRGGARRIRSKIRTSYDRIRSGIAGSTELWCSSSRCSDAVLLARTRAENSKSPWRSPSAASRSSADGRRRYPRRSPREAQAASTRAVGHPRRRDLGMPT
jgi:hypothetical protein